MQRRRPLPLALGRIDLALLPRPAQAIPLCFAEPAMPLYLYACENCGHTMEVLQSRAQQAPPRCEHCDADALQRQFATFAVGSSRSQAPQPCAAATEAGGCPAGICPMAN